MTEPGAMPDHYGQRLSASMLSDKEMIRFMTKVEKAKSAAAADGCWLWPGSPTPGGYGAFGAKNCSGLAHRLAYAVYVGPIDGGRLVRHTCNNRMCVRYDGHLILGDHIDNANDKVVSKSFVGVFAGSNNPNATIDETAVKDVIAKLRAGLSDPEIANQLAIKRHIVNQIRRGVTWHTVLIAEGWPIKKVTRRHSRPASPPETPFAVEDIGRFWNLVTKTDGCWEWSGVVVVGYGSFPWATRDDPAHKVGFRIENGRWPKPNYVLHHKCFNKLCVRFDHLEELTRSEHVSRHKTAGHYSAGHIGQRNHVNLTDEQIAAIKKLTSDGKSTREIKSSLDLSVTETCIDNIRKGKTGLHVVVDGFTPLTTQETNYATPDLVAEVVRLHEVDGLTQKQIAGKLGRSQPGIRKLLLKAGIGPRPRGYKSPSAKGLSEKESILAASYAIDYQSMTIEQVAAKNRSTYKVVRRLLLMSGVKLRPRSTRPKT